MRALIHVQWWEANFIKRTANKVVDLLSKMELPTPNCVPIISPTGGTWTIPPRSLDGNNVSPDVWSLPGSTITSLCKLHFWCCTMCDRLRVTAEGFSSASLNAHPEWKRLTVYLGLCRMFCQARISCFCIMLVYPRLFAFLLSCTGVCFVDFTLCQWKLPFLANK